MDNLKLFKLVADALGKMGKNQSENKNSLDFSKILQNLGGFTPNEQPKDTKEQSPTSEKQAQTITSPPLQANMLGTMRSHDEFIKRVKEKNKNH